MFDKRNDLARFLAVVEAGTIGIAADRLGLSPPTLTRAIASLERKLGARLFERTPTGVRLTPFGAAAAAPARRILAEFEAADRSLDAARSGTVGGFRVTAVTGWIDTVLPQAIARFHHACPGVELRCETATRAEGLRLLETGQSDLHVGGIDAGELLPAFLRRERFVDMTAGIVAGCGHPLLEGRVTEHDLARYPWVDFDAAATALVARRPSLATLLDRLHRTTRTRVGTIVRAGPAGLLLMMSGPYLAWLSLTFLDRLPGRFLQPLPLAFGRYGYRSGFVARRAAEDLPPFRRFETILRETALGRDG